MKKIGIFYGTDSGNTHTIADLIAKKLEVDTKPMDVSKVNKQQILEYDYLILASSTYGYGDLQSDWEDMIDAFDAKDFEGKTIALVGLGDQDTYSDTFCDCLYYLYEKVRLGNVVGKTSIEGYSFDSTKSLEDGKFLGLVLDEDNQPELTQERIEKWVAEIKPFFS
ncbi:flavodoxin [Helicobacter anatolicus]|uniref:flavodoxin n=1 Tax=Helicobacter anatolicus TaxID=2905874 RepID=UPI001E54013E|nr:flavodoxin [Helicobacter anatolicus]MCE3038908.1 flavodoxin [Helicobacter anatolicus]